MMQRNQFEKFKPHLQRLGKEGVDSPLFLLGNSEGVSVKYIPFEYINHAAKLTIVGITPGNTQLDMAYSIAQALINEGKSEEDIQIEIKKVAAFGGRSMRPNLIRMLRHFNFERLLNINDVESLWEDNSDLVQFTSVIPHAAFIGNRMFSGDFETVLNKKLFKDCFMELFVASVKEMSPDSKFLGLGSCPDSALKYCVEKKFLKPEQVLGSFCHPSTAGGSAVKYFLRGVSLSDLKPLDPVRKRTEWLDDTYKTIKKSSESWTN